MESTNNNNNNNNNDNNTKLPNLLTSYQYEEPKKCIHTQQDITLFTNSPAFERIMVFVLLLNESVKQKKVSDIKDYSPQIDNMIKLLADLDAFINDYPPLHNPQRFGNKAFRQWLQRVKEEMNSLMEKYLPNTISNAIPELNEYFIGGFGNETRIDYGSGHELSFMAWLCGLTMLQVFDTKDYSALVLIVFNQYLELVRKLQRTYSLEPAGSHGVWGLDDHQFLPYVWGSAQLISHPKLKPKSVENKDMVDMLAKDYLYFRCIQYINEVKRGPFHEHSPMLFDISGVISWNKVNSGMIKMFMAEVLQKVPVIQHFPFGQLFPFKK
ncbi:unnamed protein product [Cunninghamella blakesleeana]